MADVTYPGGAGAQLPGYLAIPEGRGPWPGVVVVQDILGMTANLRYVSDRLAHTGFLALAPALYGGRGPKIGCMMRTVRAHVAGHGAAHEDLVAARNHLVADERCSGKVGLIGFCMGAGFVLQLGPRGVFDATSPNYGLLPKDVAALRGSCPVVASFGANDPIVRRGTAAKLEEVLAEGGVPRDIKEYPNAGHSFMNDHCVPGPIRVIAGLVGMGYSEPESEDAWRRITAFFNEHLR
jgi:carboxymethylenebutenolidase